MSLTALKELNIIVTKTTLLNPFRVLYQQINLPPAGAGGYSYLNNMAGTNKLKQL